jgi:hypothetical protein
LCKPREVREFSVFSRLFFPAAIWKGRINGTTLDRAGHQRIETSGSTIFRAEDRRTTNRTVGGVVFKAYQLKLPLRSSRHEIGPGIGAEPEAAGADLTVADDMRT